ncbi:hypothetical protein BDZ97DRAFT_1920221 [Flammula alnicola]|nr:hypothetical protein BDZ97DRAFT_1920221 [Flammula alnicola]
MSSSNRSDDKRPSGPGATPSALTSSRTPGSRTPRKVQWLNDQSRGSTHSREGSTHMLDERGLDPEAFKELTEKLERHSRGTPLTNIHYYPPRQSGSPSSENQPTTSDEADQTGYADTLYPSSAASSRFFDSLTSATFTPPRPSHGVPDNYIDENEDAGLPGTKDLRRYSFKKAQNVVQARLNGGSDLWRSRRGLSRQGDEARRKEVRSHRHIPTDTEKGLETEAGAPSSSGKGILSALLNLYHPPDATPSNQPSRRSSLDEEREEREYNRGQEAPKRTGKSDEKHERVYTRKKRSLGIPSMFGHISRPAAARSAGGVFGPLIASTGNLTGIASPQTSRLQPNVKRPGYRLSHYSLETKPVTRPPAAKTRNNSVFSDLQGSSMEGARTAPPTPPSEPSESFYRAGSKSNLSGLFGGYVNSIRSGRRSGYSTPGTISHDREEQSYPSSPGRKQRHKRKKAEIFITRHIAHVIRREEFLMKLTRAMMMFGGPSHRLQSQIQSAARVLDVQLSFLYLPDIVLLSFDDSGTGTSHIKLIRQASGLDLAKLNDAFTLYWKVIHDKLSVSDASVELDALMSKKPLYNWAMLIFTGGMCSASICTISFGGSFVDALISFPLGAILVLIQLLSVRNILFSHVFEVTVTTLFSFIAAALAATHKLCYSAITSSSVVLILPGFLVLTGALELMSRQIISGSVRLCFAVVYALFLGFGFTIGAQLYELMTTHKVYGAEDYTCSLTHNPSGPWYQRTPSTWWAFLTVPMFSLFLSMRNQAAWNRKEMVLLVAIASAGWVTNHFTGRRFVGQSDIIAAVGAFAVGLISNSYSRIFSGNAFVVMITGILFQLPSGLGSGGLLSYASQETSGSPDSYLSGFRTALKLVSVAIGLTIGLGLSCVLTHPIQSRKREAGIFSL